MVRILERESRAADIVGPGTSATGQDLACVVCHGTRFYKREALLNTPGMTFLKLDWANATASCRVCAYRRAEHRVGLCGWPGAL